MGNSGYVDWGRLDRSLPWVRVNQQHHTYVYAFWLVDYGRCATDRGVGLFKGEDRHPDWFVHADTADRVLAAYIDPGTWVSPNVQAVFGDDLAAVPLLGSILLGTADAMYLTTGSDPGRLWWADRTDLTRRGKALLKQLDRLYERSAILVTFLDKPTDENSGPRDPR